MHDSLQLRSARVSPGMRHAGRSLLRIGRDLPQARLPRLRSGFGLLIMTVCVLVCPWQLPLHAQSRENPAYLVFRTITTAPAMDRFVDDYLQRLKDYGLAGRVYVSGQKRLILAGPITSRAAFDAAIDKLGSDYDDSQGAEPFFLPAREPPIRTEGSDDAGANPMPQQQGHPPGRVLSSWPSSSTTRLKSGAW